MGADGKSATCEREVTVDSFTSLLPSRYVSDAKIAGISCHCLSARLVAVHPSLSMRGAYTQSDTANKEFGLSPELEYCPLYQGTCVLYVEGMAIV